LQPIIDIEKSWLPPHAFAPNPSNPTESEMLPIDQVFRTVQLRANEQHTKYSDCSSGDHGRPRYASRSPQARRDLTLASLARAPCRWPTLNPKLLRENQPPGSGRNQER